MAKVNQIILLASVLKPVDEPRMLEKFAGSLIQTSKYDINIIGFSSKKVQQSSPVQFYPLFNFKRNSLKRFFAPLRALRYFNRIAPDILIIHTHELLWPAVIYSVTNRTRILYDVQENYQANILDRKPGLSGRLIGGYIRMKERITRPWISHYFLAETSYQTLGFTRNKSTVLLNKFHPVQTEPKPSSAGRQLLFCGTISVNYGITDAIEYYKQLRTVLPDVTLKIVGHCTDEQLHKQLKKDPEINYQGSALPVPHTEILKEIQATDFGIVAHRPTPSISGCFPTRIYEFMAYGKPFLVRNHPFWAEYSAKRDACIVTDFQSDVQATARFLDSNAFYRQGVPTDIYWKDEESKLLNLLDGLTL